MIYRKNKLSTWITYSPWTSVTAICWFAIKSLVNRINSKREKSVLIINDRGVSAVSATLNACLGSLINQAEDFSDVLSIMLVNLHLFCLNMFVNIFSLNDKNKSGFGNVWTPICTKSLLKIITFLKEEKINRFKN